MDILRKELTLFYESQHLDLSISTIQFCNLIKKMLLSWLQ